MKKILIVDDNQNNRILLRAVLEEYADEEAQDLAIDEATNGIEAVQMSNSGYDLILMDIMMPEMDGIEATKRIRAADSKVLIIAVSAVDDAARQKEILLSGAEDYIPKPINVDIFTARLGNYFALITARKNPPPHRTAHNLYSREIYSRRLTFFVENEDDLAEFWEYYLLNPQLGCALLSDTVRTLYAIGSIALKFSLNIPIWVEESKEHFYFTMEGLESLDPKFIKLVMVKNPGVTDYKFEQGRISIRVLSSKITDMKQETVPAVQSVKAEPQPVAPVSQPTPVAQAATVQFATTDESENRTYNYMDEDDLGDIRNYISKLNSLLLIVGSGDINVEEVDEIAAYLDRIGKIASIYSESYQIGRSLSALSAEIRTHMQGFIDKSASLGSMASAFSRDLMSWLRLIFDEGAPSVSYMDDTIIANAQMIGSMLTMDDASGDAADLDDIFDF